MTEFSKPSGALSFPALIQTFFTDYVLHQRALSPNTIAAYRDAMLLLLDFAEQRLGKAASKLQLSDFTPELILAFLDDLEQQRHNCARSRNLRLMALRAFLKFAARRDLTALPILEQALGVPSKRSERPMLGFLTHEEMLAVIGEPGNTWTAQRDHLLWTLLYNTGARVSEMIGVHVADVVLDASPYVHLHGKGRKQRAVPLWRSTVRAIRAWLRQNPAPVAEAPLLPNRDRHPMTRNNVNQRLKIAVARAAQVYPSLAERHVSPHCIRHTTAMAMLQSGVAFNVTALWLGHESTATTHQYVEANLAMKEQALARLQEPANLSTRYRPPGELRHFLEAL